MPFLNATQAAAAAGETVHRAPLVHFDVDVEGSDLRVWGGFGDITIGADTWRGLGELGSISAVPCGYGDSANSVDLTLSGLPSEILDVARAENFRGRLVTIYGQFFDSGLQPLDSKFALFVGRLDVPSYGGVGPSNRSISVPAETIWTGRNGAAFAFYSHLDQQARFAGDMGLEFVASLKNKVIRFPSSGHFDEP